MVRKKNKKESSQFFLTADADVEDLKQKEIIKENSAFPEKL